MSAPTTLIHATPSLDKLPASDAESLYLVSLFQQSLPSGSWAVTTGAWGDNGGKLPFVTHRGHRVPAGHIHSLPGFEDPDERLSSEDKVDSLCWKAYIEQNVVDLVNHTFYSLPPNYPQTIAKAQFQDLGFPQNQYIPQRLRSIIKTRLQHVGLWGLGGLNVGDAADEDRKRMEEEFVVGPGGTVAPRAWNGWRSGQEVEKRKRKWGEQQLESRVKTVFDPLTRRLGDDTYFFGDSPSTADLTFFSQLTFLLTPTLPNPFLPDFLRASYPSLVAHHDRVLAALFPLGWPSAPRHARAAAQPSSWSETIASWLPGGGAASAPTEKEKEKKGPKTKKEVKFERGRWLWFAGATVAMVTYVFASGMLGFEFGDEDEEEWEVADGEEEREEVVVMVEEEDEE
ncbi:hypothetical protein IAT38_001710 [Cryptococcus sp. DSM 104549]